MDSYSEPFPQDGEESNRLASPTRRRILATAGGLGWLLSSVCVGFLAVSAGIVSLAMLQEREDTSTVTELVFGSNWTWMLLLAVVGSAAPLIILRSSKTAVAAEKPSASSSVARALAIVATALGIMLVGLVASVRPAGSEPLTHVWWAWMIPQALVGVGWYMSARTATPDYPQPHRLPRWAPWTIAMCIGLIWPLAIAPHLS